MTSLKAEENSTERLQFLESSMEQVRDAWQAGEKALDEIETVETIYEQVKTAHAKFEAMLQEVLDKKLWKKGKIAYQTQEDYLKRRWGIVMRSRNRKRRANRLREALPPEISEGIPDSHFACLSLFPQEMHAEIIERAKSITQNVRPTEADISRAAQLVKAEHMKTIREQCEPQVGVPQNDEEDEDDTEGDIDDPKPETEPAKPKPRSNGAARTAADHPIVCENEIREKVNRWYRMHAKWEREALAENTVPEELFSLVGSMSKAEMIEWVMKRQKRAK